MLDLLCENNAGSLWGGNGTAVLILFLKRHAPSWSVLNWCHGSLKHVRGRKSHVIIRVKFFQFVVLYSAVLQPSVSLAVKLRRPVKRVVCVCVCNKHCLVTMNSRVWNEEGENIDTFFITLEKRSAFRETQL